LKGLRRLLETLMLCSIYATNPELVSTTNPKIHLNENVVATFNLLEAMEDNQLSLMNYKRE